MNPLGEIINVRAEEALAAARAAAKRTGLPGNPEVSILMTATAMALADMFGPDAPEEFVVAESFRYITPFINAIFLLHKMRTRRVQCPTRSQL